MMLYKTYVAFYVWIQGSICHFLVNYNMFIEESYELNSI